MNDCCICGNPNGEFVAIMPNGDLVHIECKRALAREQRYASHRETYPFIDPKIVDSLSTIDGAHNQKAMEIFNQHLFVVVIERLGYFLPYGFDDFESMEKFVIAKARAGETVREIFHEKVALPFCINITLDVTVP